jgi:cysteine-rich repeat protein
MSCAAGGNGDFDVWVSFVASAAAHRVRTDVASTGSDSSIEVYSGTCGSLTEIGCNGDISGSNYLSDTCVGGLTPGETYYVRVGAYNDGQFGACAGNYAITVESAPGSVCGDGAISCVANSEQCDDGNTNPGDGCDENCRIEPICGNSVVEAGEQCDDGNVAPGDGCDADCQTEISGVPAVSEWGLLVLVLIGLTVGTVMFGRKTQAAA